MSDKSNELDLLNEPQIAAAPVYYVDPERLAYTDATGLYVRSRAPDGREDSHDIATLTADSLTRWLRSRGGTNELAESVVRALLRHDA